MKTVWANMKIKTKNTKNSVMSTIKLALHKDLITAWINVVFCLPHTPIVFAFAANCLTVFKIWLCYEI